MNTLRRRLMDSREDSSKFTIESFEYSGNAQSFILSIGVYQLECWGAQGGSNAVDSDYGITANDGGKGGYSIGQLTVSKPTPVKVYVGGEGGSNYGGWNGGGNTTGYSTYDSDDEYGTSWMGGGGGATDIRLSDGSLYSRMIVAGGGSGGTMCYRSVTTYWTTVSSGDISSLREYPYGDGRIGRVVTINDPEQGATYKVSWSGVSPSDVFVEYFEDYDGENWLGIITSSTSPDFTFTAPIATYKSICIAYCYDLTSGTYSIQKQETSTDSTTSSQIGYVGGGTVGGGGSDYQGTQINAGYNGSFGSGADQNAISFRYCSGAGGGGWYGGGSNCSDNIMSSIEDSGGGSGWVNTYANRSYRPSGYTGLQLDSGTTYGGNLSFPAPNGGNETGHGGNGYARITRIGDTAPSYDAVGNHTYTGSSKLVYAQKGTYLIECWGARGGNINTTKHGGFGGYSVGKLTLMKDTVLYIYVGGSGAGGTSTGDKTGGFNGGGNGKTNSATYASCSGGGASDVRIEEDSLYARVIVAGGGGGAGSYNSNAANRYVGGVGGGLSGSTPSQYSNSYKSGTGGTQTAAGISYKGSTVNTSSAAAFGTGGGVGANNTSGGGGGWYGGGSGQRAAGGGGSGYVYTSETATNYPSGCLLNSSYYLVDAATYDGNTEFPSTSGSTETGHNGDGYVRITKL